MMKHNVHNLEGALLDAAVAKAEGLPVHPGVGRYIVATEIGHVWAHEIGPSRDWRDGGPIIERERITLVAHDAGYGDGPEWSATPDPFSSYIDLPLPIPAYRGDPGSRGPTPLVAAMRAYVASKFGDEVEL